MKPAQVLPNRLSYRLMLHLAWHQYLNFQGKPLIIKSDLKKLVKHMKCIYDTGSK